MKITKPLSEMQVALALAQNIPKQVGFLAVAFAEAKGETFKQLVNLGILQKDGQPTERFGGQKKTVRKKKNKK